MARSSMMTLRMLLAWRELEAAAGYYPLPPRFARRAARLDPRHGAFLVHRFRRA